MKNLCEIFKSGILKNKENSNIKLSLIPSEIQNNKQYILHLKSLLKFNNENTKELSILNKIKNAENFLIECENKLEKLKSRNPNNSLKTLNKSNISVQNDKNEKNIEISWSPIYKPKENISVESIMKTWQEAFSNSKSIKKEKNTNKIIQRKVFNCLKTYSQNIRDKIKEFSYKQNIGNMRKYLFKFKFLYFFYYKIIKLVYKILSIRKNN